MRFMVVLLAIFLFMPVLSIAQTPEDAIQHKTLILESGRFSGWPANQGIWSWENEIVVGFSHGYYKKNPTGGHDIDSEKGSELKQARSLDGGETWVIEDANIIGNPNAGEAPATLKAALDFSHPDLALRFSGNSMFYSLDRCKSWEGPHELPKFGRPGLQCRTDYIVEGKSRVTAFIAAQKEGGGEGQPLCIRTTDGGQTWHLVGWIGKQPPADYGYAIMPATVALNENSYLSMIRRGGKFRDGKRWWIEAFLSPDNGQSWYMLDAPRIDNAGNPATLTRLADGSIAMAYGWRHAPYGLRARISTDNGQTWGPEIILRDDGASWDIGYPRTVQRPDGKCVTAYYFHHPDQPERMIAATIWDPKAAYPLQNALTDAEKDAGWVLLFDGKTLDGWMNSNQAPSKTPVEQEALNPHGCGGYLLIHKQQWDHFKLSLDFKLSPECNSGIFFRTLPLTPPTGKSLAHNGIEVAIDAATSGPYTNTGAIYDLAQATVNAMRPVGEWNHVELTCAGDRIAVVLNGEAVSQVDLSGFTEIGKRADGSPHKFDEAFSEHTKKGYIGFQDHGGDCWYKNIKLLPLNEDGSPK